MLPSNTNNNSPCTPVSSNCVIWQGPDIACIDLCNGDTVSDVVAKLATKLCEIIDASCQCDPDLSGLDVSCLTASTPANLVEALQLLVDQICTNRDDETKDIGNLPLPECLQYRDMKGGGDLITELPVTDWATLIGNELCSIATNIITIDQNISNLTSRIATLEACVLPCSPKEAADFDIVSNCLFQNETVSISTLVLAIEQTFCSFEGAVGKVSAINQAISSQSITASSERLSVNGTMGDIIGWKTSPANLAESNVNQWKVIGDMYTAIQDIQEALPKACSDINFAFTYNTIDTSGNGVPDTINLNFQATQLLPGFTDCNGVTTVVVTDADGSSTSQNINVAGLVDSPGGANIDISTLNRFSSLNLSIPFCATDGTSQCADRQQVIIPLTVPCPQSVTISPGAASILVSFPNTLGSTVSYQIDATSRETGELLGTTTIVNPGSSVNYNFTGASPGLTYNVQITVIAGPNQRNSCPIETVTIPGVACTDLEVVTPSTAVVETSDVFLGLYDDGVTVNNFTPKAEKSWTRKELEDLCPIAQWDKIFESQYDSVITNPKKEPVVNHDFVIPS